MHFMPTAHFVSCGTASLCTLHKAQTFLFAFLHRMDTFCSSFPLQSSRCYRNASEGFSAENVWGNKPKHFHLSAANPLGTQIAWPVTRFNYKL